MPSSLSRPPIPDAASAAPPVTDDLATVASTRRIIPSDENAFDWRGRRLAHFEIEAPLGAGGMGTVWRAMDLNLGRPVALKILPPEFATDREHLARFRQEAKAAARLDHEHIARVYYCGEDGGIHFIAFEFVDGQDLRTIVSERGPLPVEDALCLMSQVAQGLAHAAQRGVVHRDIKPSNVIINAAGAAKIVDMGLARMDGPADALTRSGVTLGTYDYISPEQAIEPRAVDARSDLYSLGCTFYHALTGRAPVPEGATAAAKLQHHQHGRPTDPVALRPDLPDAVVAVLARLMAKKPNDRYQSAYELVEELAGMVGPGRIDRSRLTSRKRSIRPSLHWLGIAALALVAFVAFQEWRQPLLPLPTTAPLESTSNSVTETASVVRPPEVEWVEAATVEELKKRLTADQVNIRLTGERYDVAADAGSAGLSFQGRKLMLVAADAYRPPVLRLVRGAGEGALTLLRIAGAERAQVTLRGLNLTADSADRVAPVTLAAAVNVERLTVDLCTFDGRRMAPDGELTALHISNEGKPTPVVAVTATAFIRGTAGLQLTGPAHANFTNCVWIGSRGLVVARDTGGPADSTIRLDQCTALLASGTAFRFDDGAGAALQAGHSLFVGPNELTAGGQTAAPTLIAQRGTRRGDVEFRPLFSRDGALHHNGYAGLGAWWADETGDRRIVATNSDDCTDLRFAWFESEPLEFARPPLRTAQPLEVVADDPQGAVALDTACHDLVVDRAGTPQWLGAQLGPWGRVHPTGPASVKVAPYHRPKVVDPNRETNSSAGVYRTLAQALPDARPDDLILIRSNQPITVAPLRVERPDSRLTIASFPGYRPVLRLAPSSDLQPAMFQVLEGTLTLRGLHLRLQPERGESRSQSLTMVAAGAGLHLAECVVTLEEIDDVRLSVVSTPDSDGMPRVSGDRRAASVRLDHCFVRGKGDLLNVGSGRRAECDIVDSLLALDGTVAQIEGPARDRTEPTSTLRMHRVTAALGDRLIDLTDAGDPAAMIKLETKDTLLAALSGQPLFRIAGANSDDEVRRRFIWTPERNTLVAAGPILFRGTDASPDHTAWTVDANRLSQLCGNSATPPSLARVRWAAVAGVNGLNRARPPDLKAKLIADASNRVGNDDLEIGAPIERLPTGERSQPPAGDQPPGGESTSSD